MTIPSTGRGQVSPASAAVGGVIGAGVNVAVGVGSTVGVSVALTVVGVAEGMAVSVGCVVAVGEAGETVGSDGVVTADESVAQATTAIPNIWIVAKRTKERFFNFLLLKLLWWLKSRDFCVAKRALTSSIIKATMYEDGIRSRSQLYRDS